MSKTKRNILIITGAVVAVIAITLAIVLPLTLNNATRDKTFTVTFNSNGGTAVDSIKDVEYGALITEPSSPTRVGYTFDGWCKDAKLTDLWKFAGDKVTSDITLYARWAYNATDGLNMILNGSEYTVAGIGSSNETNISIPETVNGLPVTTIAQNAFANLTYIQTVFIPDTVTKILKGAFSGCSNLTSVILPSKLTAIEDETFLNCANLVQFNIPSGITKIGELAFSGCAKISSVNLPASLVSIGENAFSGCIGIESLSVEPSNTYFYSRDNGQDLNCIIAITSQAGSTVNKVVVGCKNSVIPANGSRPVTVIGYGAFYGCRTLTRISIPYGVTTIEDDAFQGCGLEGIIIPSSVVTIGDRAFSSCESLKSVTFNSPSEDSADTGVQVIGQEAFAYCSLDSNSGGSGGITLPGSLTRLGRGVLCGCDFNYMTVSYGDDASKLQSILDRVNDNNLQFDEIEVRVNGTRGTHVNIKGLA